MGGKRDLRPKELRGSRTFGAISCARATNTQGANIEKTFTRWPAW